MKGKLLKNIVVLGSTGSIGKQTIDVVKNYPGKFRILGISGRSNSELIAEQARELKVMVAAMSDPSAAKNLRNSLRDTSVRVLEGMVGLEELATMSEAHLIVNALVGSAGLLPTLRAIGAGKDLALANKESLVVGGELVIPLVEEKRTSLIPIDSEHSAMFQCLVGEEGLAIRRILLTGSGGPFRGKKKPKLKYVKVEEALAHPRWKMGRKITIDSATLMNKGLEVIEAHHLFGISYDQIEVIVHPESILHSMVEFCDGSIKAHLGFTDMRIPIQYALSYPDRLPSPLVGLDFLQLKHLTFEAPDWDTFPCLSLAFEVGRKGGTYPAVLNAANEEVVAAFLKGEIGFLRISEVVCEVLSRYQPTDRKLDFSALQEAENWARAEARNLIETGR